jgi:hypothetical protein
MKVTIIPEDRWIRRDGTQANLPDWSFDDANIHAIQWDGAKGEIEYNGTPKPLNDSFTSSTIIAPYLAALDAYLASIPEPEPTEPLPPPPSYTAFWDALMASTVYGSIRTQSMASLPMNTLATEFIALLGDAKAGRANEAAIQASMSAVFATGTFTTADAAEFTAALAAGYLDGIYTLGAPA